jgi:PAS domain S-box-containing protein
VLSADEYRAIFEASPDGCLVVDSEGVIRDANPQVEALFGWSRGDLLGKPVEMLVPEAQRPGHGHHRSTYVANSHVRPMGAGLDLSGLRRNGSRFPAEISLSPWLAADGETRVICSVRDVSERKRLQDFSEGMLRATEDERLRIARELHDDTAQRLATLILRVRVLAEEVDAQARGTLLGHIRAELGDALEGVQRVARGLRPPELTEVGLAAALVGQEQ